MLRLNYSHATHSENGLAVICIHDIYIAFPRNFELFVKKKTNLECLIKYDSFVYKLIEDINCTIKSRIHLYARYYNIKYINKNINAVFSALTN